MIFKFFFNALKFVFPSDKIYGCHFHFSQALFRKINSFVLKSDYQKNIEFRKSVKMIFNLSFFPPCGIEKAFLYCLDVLKDKLHFDKLIKFIDYFFKIYIANSEYSSRFKFEFWSIFNRINDDVVLTKNSIEGWHKGFNALVNTKHLNLGKLVDCLRLETEKIRFKISRCISGDFDVVNARKKILF